MATIHRDEMTDAEWGRLAPQLPRQAGHVGRPAHDHRRIVNGILWKLRTGVPWRDLPTCYGKWHPIYLRFRRGSERGVWWHILITLQQRKQLTLNVVLVDSTTFKVHRHGGGPKGGV